MLASESELLSLCKLLELSCGFCYSDCGLVIFVYYVRNSVFVCIIFTYSSYFLSPLLTLSNSLSLTFSDFCPSTLLVSCGLLISSACSGMCNVYLTYVAFTACASASLPSVSVSSVVLLQWFYKSAIASPCATFGLLLSSLLFLIFSTFSFFRCNYFPVDCS